MKRLIRVFAGLGVFLFFITPRAMASLCTSCAYITGDTGIYAWDTVANTLSLVMPTPSGLSGLDSLVFDINGNAIFDSSVTPGKVYRYNFATNTSTLLATFGSVTNDLALEPAGNSVLVTSKGDNTIYRLNLSNNTSSVLYSGTLTPDGITYDNTGKLFACLGQTQNQGEVVQLNPTSGAIIKTLTGINQADGLAFNSTTGMLYAGSNATTGGGFYTIPTDLSNATFTNLNRQIDGVGTAGNFLYLIQRNTAGLQYNLTTNTLAQISGSVAGSDDIAPLSGLGSPNPVPTITFSANPTTISVGNSSSLSWTILNATSAVIDQGIGNISPTSGTHSVSPIGTLTYTLTAWGTGGTSSAQVTVTVLGTPPPPTSSIQFSPTTYSVSEDAGQATLIVTRTGDTTGTSTVHFASADGTATAGRDYVGVSGILTFNPGDTAESFEVPLINDHVADGSETVNFALSQVTGASLGTSQAVLTINDPATTPPPPPSPFISQLVPNSALVTLSSPFTMRVLGTGFDATAAQVIWNNSISLAVVSRSTTEVDVTVNPGIWSNTTGTYPVIVSNPGNVNSNQATFTVLPASGGGNPNPPPFVVQDPMANPNPTYTTTTNLTVLGGTLSSGGESVLTYNWQPVGAQPGAVFFSANQSHSASHITGTFFAPGVYHLQVTITDTVTALSVTTKVLDVTVISKATSLTLTPKTQAITPDQTVKLTATVKDQFGTILNPTLVWTNSAGSLAPTNTTAVLSVNLTVRMVHITAALTDNSLSDYADVTVLFGAGGIGDLSQAVPAPVPFRSDAGLPGITFKHLNPGTKIRIFSTDGHLVQTLTSNDGSDTLWNLANSRGDKAASGVYLYIMECNGQKKEGKLVLIL